VLIFELLSDMWSLSLKPMIALLIHGYQSEWASVRQSTISKSNNRCDKLKIIVYVG
jgi:hypothetical protein